MAEQKYRLRDGRVGDEEQALQEVLERLTEQHLEIAGKIERTVARLAAIRGSHGRRDEVPPERP